VNVLNKTKQKTGKARVNEKQENKERQKAHCLERTVNMMILLCSIKFKELFLGIEYHR
jgi:hypothetical protein